MEITDTISINAPPTKVYDTIVFFFKSSENYRVWHKDHVSCYWKKGNDFSPGSVLVAEEYLHGRLHKMGFKIVSNEPGRSVDYKMLFPFSLICSGGSFKMASQDFDPAKNLEPPDCKTAGLQDSTTLFSASLKFRNWLLAEKYFRKEVEAISQHLKEEGIALKGILASSSNPRTLIPSNIQAFKS